MQSNGEHPCVRTPLQHQFPVLMSEITAHKCSQQMLYFTLKLRYVSALWFGLIFYFAYLHFDFAEGGGERRHKSLHLLC